MKTMSYTESRARYAEMLDGVNQRPRRSHYHPRRSRARRHRLPRGLRVPPGDGLPHEFAGQRPPPPRCDGASGRPTRRYPRADRDRLDVLLVWDENAWDDYLWWQRQDRKVLKRIKCLLADIQRNGNQGIGKPEALKHDFAGYWSRRITDEHRLVKIVDDEVSIAACRYHYA